MRRLSQTDLAREQSTLETLVPAVSETRRGPVSLTRSIYPFGISRKRLEQAIRQTASPAAVSEHLSDADLVLTLRTFYRRKPQALREAEARGLPIYVLKNNTISQMEQSLIAMQGDKRDSIRLRLHCRRLRRPYPKSWPATGNRALPSELLHPAPPAPAGAEVQPLIAEPGT